MTILDRILEDTRALVAERRRVRSLADLEAMPGFERTPHPLAPALQTSPVGVLAELKKASPSKGLLRASFDVAAIARGYADAGAAALSVLTEPRHFLGSLDDLAAVREAVALPLLRKDFVFDPYQLFEARAYGADAVLLIATMLERDQLAELHDAATELGLACLVEVYAERELDALDFDRVRILGVNNRDLRTFEVDLDRSLRVFRHAPSHVVRVSESGLRTAADLAHLRRHGVDAVLIGETFMRAPDPGNALRQLVDETAALLDETPAPDERPR